MFWHCYVTYSIHFETCQLTQMWFNLGHTRSRQILMRSELYVIIDDILYRVYDVILIAIITYTRLIGRWPIYMAVFKQESRIRLEPTRNCLNFITCQLHCLQSKLIKNFFALHRTPQCIYSTDEIMSSDFETFYRTRGISMELIINSYFPVILCFSHFSNFLLRFRCA